MNDLDILRDAWPAPEPPSDAARERVRADLLVRTARRPRRRWSPRLVAVAGPAIAIAAGLVAVQNVGDGHSPSPLPAVPIASAAVLEAAAQAAEDDPFTPPRDDQWIYIKDAFSPASEDLPNARQEERWRRADGAGFAFYDESGNLRVETMRPRKRGKPIPLGPAWGYKQLAELPTNPDGLLRWAYGLTDNITGGGSTEHSEVYGVFVHMLADNLLPPDLQAALFRALKQVPGVTVTKTEIDGRRVFALDQTDNWLRQELLLDAGTYDYVGQSGTVVRDATIDPMKAGNATGEIKRGQKAAAMRLVTAIVDEPGQRP
jgi:hypothetical protein